MNLSHLESLTRVLQASISPVALISGVGLLTLSFTNRFSRVADRLRELVRERKAGARTPALEAQIRIFYRRARLLRLTISCAAGSVLLLSVLVLLLFVIAVLDFSLDLLVLGLFALSLVFVIVSLALFLLDMGLSLEGLEEELRG